MNAGAATFAALSAAVACVLCKRNTLRARRAPTLPPRTLGAMERVMWQLSQQRGGAQKVAVAVRLRGPRVTEEAVARAAKRMSVRHPVLRSVLADLGDGEQGELSTMVSSARWRAWCGD